MTRSTAGVSARMPRSFSSCSAFSAKTTLAPESDTMNDDVVGHRRRVDGGRGATGDHDGEVGQGPLVAGAGGDGDAVLGLDAQRDQPGPDLADHDVELGPGDGDPLVAAVGDDGVQVGGAVGAGVDAVAEHVSDALCLPVQHGLVDRLVGGGVDLRGGGEHRASSSSLGSVGARMMTQRAVRGYALSATRRRGSVSHRPARSPATTPASRTLRTTRRAAAARSPAAARGSCPTFCTTCTASQVATPTATSRPNASSARAATTSTRPTTNASSRSSPVAPTKPSSSPATEKMKSLSW